MDSQIHIRFFVGTVTWESTEMVMYVRIIYKMSNVRRIRIYPRNTDIAGRSQRTYVGGISVGSIGGGQRFMDTQRNSWRSDQRFQCYIHLGKCSRKQRRDLALPQRSIDELRSGQRFHDFGVYHNHESHTRVRRRTIGNISILV